MSYTHLTRDERNVIYRMRFLGHSEAEIARCLGRHRGTIGRECKRNALPDGRYESGPAQTWAHVRRRAHLRRPKTGHRRLMAYVGERLQDCWSPEQIAGRLSVRPPAGLAAREVRDHLLRAGVAVAIPDGAIRFAPHWPNDPDRELDGVASALDAALG